MASTDFHLMAQGPVFHRTLEGQREAISHTAQLDDVERRFLLMVNGFTPLVTLTQHRLDPCDVPRVVSHLVDAGLIEQIENRPQSPQELI